MSPARCVCVSAVYEVARTKGGLARFGPGWRTHFIFSAKRPPDKAGYELGRYASPISKFETKFTRGPLRLPSQRAWVWTTCGETHKNIK